MLSQLILKIIIGGAPRRPAIPPSLAEDKNLSAGNALLKIIAQKKNMKNYVAGAKTRVKGKEDANKNLVKCDSLQTANSKVGVDLESSKRVKK